MTRDTEARAAFERVMRGVLDLTPWHDGNYRSLQATTAWLQFRTEWLAAWNTRATQLPAPGTVHICADCDCDQMQGRCAPCRSAQTARSAERADGEGDWIKTTDRLPEKPGIKTNEIVDCLIYFKGKIYKRAWNCEYLCWEHHYYGDFFAYATEPTHWMPLPCGPIDAERAAKEAQ